VLDTAPSRREHAGARLPRPRAELVAWGVLLALALVVRLIDLGDRPFHHDESQDAYFSWLFETGGGYEYDPLLHGPLRFYLTAAVYIVFGDSDFTARLAPALMGTLIVALPWFLRGALGRLPAYAAAILLAFSPAYLYFSRFAREDIYIAAITLGMLVVAARFFERPHRAHPALLGALTALSFATKETTWITGFVAITFLVAVVAWQRREAGSVRDTPVARTFANLGWEPYAWGAAAFLAVYTVLFTTFFTHPEGVYGLYTGLEYWLGQHEVGRGGEPEVFYAVLLFGSEWPVLLLGAAGAAATARRPTLLRLFLIWAFLVSLVVYSWAGEKFAWLVLHPLLPLILLAGMGAEAIWAGRRHWYGRLALAAAILGLAYSGYASFLVNAEHGADPRELLVSTQSSTEVKEVAEEVLAIAERRPRLKVTIDSAEGATFPWAWYFRHLDVGYIDLSTTGDAPQTDVLILTSASNTRLAPTLTGFDGRRFPFRVWWVRDYGGATSPGNWLRWLTEREPWSPTGGMPEWLYVRRVVAADS
jgi:uncharacterized protein (TIGR03663 family)